MKTFMLTFISCMLVLQIQSQIVDIPDPAFKQCLLGNAAINTNMDGEIQESEALAFTGTIDCQELGIEDATGVEAFVNVTGINFDSHWLGVNNNMISSLDLNNNVNLKFLSIYDNSLTSLDLSNNTLLEDLNCSSNYDLSDLDLSNNTSLVYLSCYGNSLSELDLINNTSLVDLKCFWNSLTALDLSNNTLLKGVDVSGNELTTLDVSMLPSLDVLYCPDNNLQTLDLNNNPMLMSLSVNSNFLTTLDVSNAPNLSFFHCDQNPIESLDLSNNPNLQNFSCKALPFELTSLDLRNGNNEYIQRINVQNQIHLTCIDVDDTEYSEQNWNGSHFNFPFQTGFSEDCSLGIEEVSSSVISIFPNPAANQFTIQLDKDSELERIHIYNTLGQLVHTATALVVDSSKLPSGMYYVEVITNKGRATEKLIIQ